MIYRGTTPKHLFYFPYAENTISVLKITYFQQGEVIFTKEKQDVTFNAEDEIIELRLSQEDTLKFKKYKWLDRAKDSLVLIQIRFKKTNNECWVSEVMEDRVGDVLLDGVI